MRHMFLILMCPLTLALMSCGVEDRGVTDKIDERGSDQDSLMAVAMESNGDAAVKDEVVVSTGHISSKAYDDGMVIEVFDNGELSGRKYYRGGRLVQDVEFGYPRTDVYDSVEIVYADDCVVRGVKYYNCMNGTCEDGVSATVYRYYKDMARRRTNCRYFQQIAGANVMAELVSDICTVTGSTLPRGGRVDGHKRVVQHADTNIVSYDNLNARFRGLSLLVASYFYDRVLKDLSVTTAGTILQSCCFRFENGSITNSVTYQKGRVRYVSSEIVVSSGGANDTVRSVREYRYR